MHIICLKILMEDFIICKQFYLLSKPWSNPVQIYILWQFTKPLWPLENLFWTLKIHWKLFHVILFLVIWRKPDISFRKIMRVSMNYRTGIELHSINVYVPRNMHNRWQTLAKSHKQSATYSVTRLMLPQGT
jgi:hypothetical protein